MSHLQQLGYNPNGAAYATIAIVNPDNPNGAPYATITIGDFNPSSSKRESRSKKAKKSDAGFDEGMDGNVGSRKSDRKRKSKKRALNDMYDGATTTSNGSRTKRQKTSHASSSSTARSAPKKDSNLAQWVSPAPIHWRIVEVREDAAGEAETKHANAAATEHERKSGRFRVRLKVQKHPLKEALMRIGPHNFTLDDVLTELADVEEDDENKRTEPARKRLKEELGVIRGCWHVRGAAVRRHYDESEYGYDEDVRQQQQQRHADEFNATEFIKVEQARLDELNNADESDDQCFRCGKRGELVLCDGCPHVFHLFCVNLLRVPEDSWFCPECVQRGVGHNEPNDFDDRVDAERGDQVANVVVAEPFPEPDDEDEDEDANEEGQEQGKKEARAEMPVQWMTNKHEAPLQVVDSSVNEELVAEQQGSDGDCDEGKDGDGAHAAVSNQLGEVENALEAMKEQVRNSTSKEEALQKQNKDLEAKLEELQPLKIYGDDLDFGELEQQALIAMEKKLEEKLKIIKQIKQAKLKSMTICIVCQDAARNHVFVPCGHVCVCGDCKQHYQGGDTECPICREKVTDVMQMFHA